MSRVPGPPPILRRRLVVEGVVQGVGFRPFVFNLAMRSDLAGFVTNTSSGVVVEIQGSAAELDRFVELLRAEAPPLARITAIAAADIPPDPSPSGFVIVPSTASPGAVTLIPPDVAVCAACLREIRDPSDRRAGYPFTNCTDCGPRWTIIAGLPYDRPATSMAAFAMCPLCLREYDDPRDRRFHAQPNACPTCGPRLTLVGEQGALDVVDPLAAAADLLAAGRVLAVKGLGGFHLAVRADQDAAVMRLRERKRREAKPLAVMVADVAAARRLVHLRPAEEDLLLSPAAPIVLCERLADSPVAAVVALSVSPKVAPAVAPDHRRLGLLLPYTPLHHLLLDRLAERGVTALVMTSGNAGGEPICLDNAQARERLAGIADAWLVHDRDILRRADDSVVQVCDDGPLLRRRSRGYAPVPVFVDPAGRGATGDEPILGLGPELKNTVCLLQGDRAFLSPHVGDLETLEACDFLAETAQTLQAVLACRPRVIAHDLHPGYFTTRWARGLAEADPGLTLVGVQHHHAHLAAVLAELRMKGPALGLIMDGTGYGTDGTIWGGEILAGDAAGFTRVGHLEPVPLPGGDAAIRAPWRTAVSYLRLAFGPDRGAWPDLPFLREHPVHPVHPEHPLHPVQPVLDMLAAGVNSPLTSSCGRLFDAVAALTGRWSEVHYEAQAAIELTALTTATEVRAARPFPVPLPAWPTAGADPFLLPVAPLIREAAHAVARGASPATLSARLHRTLIAMLTAAACEGARRTGLDRVVLAGGVFQNEILLAEMRTALTAAGLRPLRPRLLPPNDGAIALGQVVVARAQIERIKVPTAS